MAAHRPNAAQPDPCPEALTQKAAAALLSVSVSWLRASTAPRLLLPGHGPIGCPVLRYPRQALLEWAGIGRATAQQDARECASAREMPQGKSAVDSPEKSGGNSGGSRAR
jgi:hypothetical protein